LIGNRHPDIPAPPFGQQRHKQAPQWPDQRKKRRMHDRAFAEIDQAMASGFVETQLHTAPSSFDSEADAAARGWRRDVGHAEMRRIDAMCGKRAVDPVDQEIRISRIIDMLKLTATADPEVTASWLNVMRTSFHTTIGEDHVAGHRSGMIAAILTQAITARSEGNNARHWQRTRALGTHAGRSSAISPGPASRAASPCNQTPADAA
jgi:hypothetical protein